MYCLKFIYRVFEFTIHRRFQIQIYLHRFKVVLYCLKFIYRVLEFTIHRRFQIKIYLHRFKVVFLGQFLYHFCLGGMWILNSTKHKFFMIFQRIWLGGMWILNSTKQDFRYNQSDLGLGGMWILNSTKLTEKKTEWCTLFGRYVNFEQYKTVMSKITLARVWEVCEFWTVQNCSFYGWSLAPVWEVCEFCTVQNMQ